MMTMRKGVLVLVAAVAAAVGLGGCVATEDVAALRAQTQAMQQELASTEALLETLENEVALQRAAVDEIDDAEAKAESQRVLDATEQALTKTREVRDAVVTGLDDLAERLERIETSSSELANTLEVVAAGGESIAPFLPPPFGTILGVVLAGLTGVAEVARRREKAAKVQVEQQATQQADAHERTVDGIVGAIEAAKGANGDQGTVDFRDPTTKALLRGFMAASGDGSSLRAVETARARLGVAA